MAQQPTLSKRAFFHLPSFAMSEHKVLVVDVNHVEDIGRRICAFHEMLIDDDGCVTKDVFQARLAVSMTSDRWYKCRQGAVADIQALGGHDAFPGDKMKIPVNLVYFMIVRLNIGIPMVAMIASLLAWLDIANQRVVEAQNQARDAQLQLQVLQQQVVALTEHGQVGEAVAGPDHVMGDVTSIMLNGRSRDLCPVVESMLNGGDHVY
jgi:hypothetical protein